MNRRFISPFCVLICVVALGACLLTWWLDRLLPKSSIHSPSGPSRVVSIAPHVTAILFAMDAGDCVAGVSDYCLLPPNVNRPRCGGVVNPNFERIIALRPQWLFLMGEMDRLRRFAMARGIEPEAINVQRYADLVRETRRMGRRLHREATAEKLIRQMESRLETVRRNARDLPTCRTLLLIERENGSLRHMIAVGGASFLSEMLELAGGQNIFQDNKQAYFQLSRESLLVARPDIIFELRFHQATGDDLKKQLREDWQAEPSLPAVKNHRLVAGVNPAFTIPGPGMIDTAEWFQKTLKDFFPPCP
ncbi:MAG: helical backbone metal receptor [Verrucomicrobiae bacterium]|nr:helical backbone metal receptor [Verrucomicrobiae bacterium]